jgi:hypothetical protein
MIELLQFIFTDFGHYVGTLFLIIAAGAAVNLALADFRPLKK